MYLSGLDGTAADDLPRLKLKPTSRLMESSVTLELNSLSARFEQVNGRPLTEHEIYLPEAYLSTTPESILAVYEKTNEPPSNFDTKVIECPLDALEFAELRQGITPHEAGIDVLERLFWLVNGFRQLPNEILGEIFSSVVAGKMCTLPGLYESDTAVALSTPIWNRVDIVVDRTTNDAALAQTHTLFARASGRANLDINLTCGLPFRRLDAQVRCIPDIVVPYSARIAHLNLNLDAEPMEPFLRLPAGSFPALEALHLSVRYYSHPNHSTWLVFGPEADPGRTFQLAPQLVDFSFVPDNWGDFDDPCICRADPF
ncbi:hypothetical protein FB451DRAFT_1549206 [Mycena latifolia]|nr:hypothetical protein FB451DRAFT_1549206 [Mycena latifolia]